MFCVFFVSFRLCGRVSVWFLGRLRPVCLGATWAGENSREVQYFHVSFLLAVSARRYIVVRRSEGMVHRSEQLKQNRKRRSRVSRAFLAGFGSGLGLGLGLGLGIGLGLRPLALIPSSEALPSTNNRGNQYPDPWKTYLIEY